MSAVGLNLPVTSTFALPLSLYYIYLQARVIQQRVITNELIGQQSTSSTADPKSTDPLATPSASPDLLQAACRAQGNFAENVPFALIFAALAELNGGNKTVLSTALGMLLVARVMHADFGIMNTKKNFAGFGRPVGFLTTAAVMAGLAGYAAVLSRGYWGF
ncbi:Hypothetical predicted protein [Lecanosticta acicola]|uniref:Membrane-associated proteins in eicosanoid and glutathione metabolism n=1 Tax=Lecanosticta acicola TaxID=111012 RepID=A0AAI8Z5M2_9PEZI|nr:Hypothetical predicted protein [Lecanosticta acicola]